MLVYDITNEKSFDNIKNWIRNIEEVTTVHFQSSEPSSDLSELITTVLLQHASADVERMILGNKCDVNDKRQVSKDRGEKVAKCTEHNQVQEVLSLDLFSF